MTEPLLLNGKPEQEFPDGGMDFLEIARGMTTAADRLKARSEAMQHKFGILTTRLAASEAATAHLKNQLEIVQADNQLLRERLDAVEKTHPPDNTDIMNILRKFDDLLQKFGQLAYEVRQARPWYIRLAEWNADRNPKEMDDG